MSLRGIANGDAVAISRKGTALFNKVAVPGDSHASLGMTRGVFVCGILIATIAKTAINRCITRKHLLNGNPNLQSVNELMGEVR